LTSNQRYGTLDKEEAYGNNEEVLLGEGALAEKAAIISSRPKTPLSSKG